MARSSTPTRPWKRRRPVPRPLFFLFLLAPLILLQGLDRMMVLVVVAEAQQQNGGEELQVFGGTPINPKKYAWFTAIRRSRSPFDLVCSGAFVGSRYVLTANHCFGGNSGLLPSNYVVQVGYLCQDQVNCNRPSQYMGVVDWRRHPAGGDFAIVVLEDDIGGVTPAVPYLGASLFPQAPVSLKNGKKLTMVGAGQDGNNQLTFFVEQLRVKYLARKKCRKKLSNPDLLTEFTVCSQSKGGASPCRGDSGAAVLVKGKGVFAKRDVIVATHIFGPRFCADPSSRVTGQFLVSHAANHLESIICKGDHSPGDWCNQIQTGSKRPKLSSSPTLSPTVDPKENIGLPVMDFDANTIAATLWNVLAHHTNEVWPVAFNHDGTRLVSGGCDGEVKVWNPVERQTSPQPLQDYKLHDGCVWSVKFSPVDSTHLATGGEDDKLVVLDFVDTVPPPSSVRSVSFSTDGVETISWHFTGSQFAYGSRHADLVQVWNLPTQQDILQFDIDDLALSVSYNPQGTLLACGFQDGTIRLWDAVTSLTIRDWKAHDDWVAAVAFSPVTGRYLASASDDDSAKIWDAATGNVLVELRGHEQWLYAIAWSPDERFVITASQDGTARIWDAAVQGDKVRAPALVLDGFPESVGGVDWSPDGQHVAVTCRNGIVYVWKLGRRGSL